MGDHVVAESLGATEMRGYMRALLDDIEALEQMLEHRQELFDTGVRRIGAEQEMFLVDESLRPALVATDVLKTLDNPIFTTELARFNLEANCNPQVFGEDCLRQLETELDSLMVEARMAAQKSNADVMLVGILPTLTQSDLSLDAMSPAPRYRELNDAMLRARGGKFRINLKGLDELETEHDNVMLEACTTSFQVHFQVSPNEFAKLYNAAQLVTAPVLAVATNSPTLLGHRLWHETRVGLFEQSVDERSQLQHARGKRARVSFGDSWVKDSVIEIFKEDIARFRMVLANQPDECAKDFLARNEAPPLSALCLHNGTVYRWNRACYGVAHGIAHLRVENRVLPAGPTVRDEVANAAFFFGLMAAFVNDFGDVADQMSFDDAKANFLAAARQGLQAQFTWLGERRRPADELILDELLPLAATGLKDANIDQDDIDRYLGIIAERTKSGRTGSQWALSSLARMDPEAPKEAKLRSLTAEMKENQWTNRPAHTWPIAELDAQERWRDSYQTVGQFMTTELITVQAQDLVDLAASIMEWENVNQVPVEDAEGRLVGILSNREVVRMVGRGDKKQEQVTKDVSVQEVMSPDVICATPTMKSLDAIELMRKHKVGCLPVVAEERLVGIITERDFLEVAAKMLRREMHRENQAMGNGPDRRKIPRN